MSIVIPALLADTPDNYKAQVTRYLELTKRAHIDICDGEFTPTPTLGAAQVWWPDVWQADIHAMVARPSEHLETLISLSPNMIIFHVEVEENITSVLKHVKKFGIKGGVALKKKTVPAEVAEAIREADHVMIFSGDLGHYGGTASLMQLEKIRLIHAIKPGVEIGWDGGVSVDNALTLAQGGVEVLNVGGALANAEDPKVIFDKLVDEINKQGVM